jgi:hypothetical protein
VGGGGGRWGEVGGGGGRWGEGGYHAFYDILINTLGICTETYVKLSSLRFNLFLYAVIFLTMPQMHQIILKRSPFRYVNE